jgi:hypothetical protein
LVEDALLDEADLLIEGGIADVEMMALDEGYSGVGFGVGSGVGVGSGFGVGSGAGVAEVLGPSPSQVTL